MWLIPSLIHPPSGPIPPTLISIVQNVGIGFPTTCSAAPYYTADYTSCGTPSGNASSPACGVLNATVAAANNQPCTPGLTNVTSPTCTCGGSGTNQGCNQSPNAIFIPPLSPKTAASCGIVYDVVTVGGAPVPLPLQSCNPNLPTALGGLNAVCLGQLTAVAPQVCLRMRRIPHETLNILDRFVCSLKSPPTAPSRRPATRRTPSTWASPPRRPSSRPLPRDAWATLFPVLLRASCRRRRALPIRLRRRRARTTSSMPASPA